MNHTDFIRDILSKAANPASQKTAQETYADWLGGHGGAQAERLVRSAPAVGRFPFALFFNDATPVFPKESTEAFFRQDLAALDLGKNAIGAGGVAPLRALAEQWPQSLLALDMGENAIAFGTDGAGVLGERGDNLAKLCIVAQRFPKSLIALKLGLNYICYGVDDMEELHALTEHLPHSLLALDLGENYFCHGSNRLAKARALAQGLPPSLLALNLGENHLGAITNPTSESGPVTYMEELLAIAQAPCTSLQSIGLVNAAAADFFTMLKTAYAATMENGLSPSLIHLETVYQGLAPDWPVDPQGQIVPWPDGLRELQQQARQSWERAHKLR